MKTIFNKEGKNGIDEMRSYFPHISGLVTFDKIKSDVVVAQIEIIKYTGHAIFDLALAHYLSENYNLEDVTDKTDDEIKALKEKDELVYHMQFAVCLFAYRDFALNKDVTHTNTGRVARMDKDSEEVNLKLIAQDDDALFKKSYKAMDRLITYIDTQKFEEWIGSMPYKHTKDVFVWNADLFDSFFSIDKSRYMFMMTLPLQREVQTSLILGIIGTERYNALLTKVRNNTLFAEESGSGSGTTEDHLLFNLIASVVVKETMAMAYEQMPIQMFPENIARQLWSAGNGAAAISLRKVLVSDIRKAAERPIMALESELIRLDSVESSTQLTETSFVSIADRASEENNFFRV